MKRKELKALAKKVAKVELKIRNCQDPKQTKKLQSQMMELCSQVDSLEDMMIVDEMVLEILEKI